MYRLSFSLWLKVADPTVILSEETVKKTGLVCFKKIVSFVCDRVRSAFGQVSKSGHG